MSTPVARLQAQPKAPPYSIEAEQSVLGGLMLDNRAWNELADRLAAEDFYREDHQLIYRAICELVGAARPCDFVTLSEHLKARGKLEEAGGLAYLGSLANDTPSAANVLAYADIVRERAVLRGLAAAGGDIADLGFRADGRSYAELLDIAEQKVFALRSRAEHARSSYHAMPELMQKLEEKIEFLRNNPTGLAGLSTGFADLDAKTTGLHPGDLVILAGRPAMGKTSFALNVAEHVVLYEKKPAAVFSMEMPADQLALRILSSFARIPMGRLRGGDLDDRDWDRLVSQGGLIREAPLYIDETGALSPLELRARARRIKARHGLGLIVVDYIQLMQVPGTKENRTNEISEISRSLKALAKELEVPVIALSQLNRGVEQRDNKRPRMADLRECVTGDTLVWLADGRRVPIRELVGSQPQVWSIDAEQKVQRATADCVWSVGRKPVLALRLASGRSLRATAEHRVRCAGGWKTLSELQAGDRVALARRVPEPEAAEQWSDSELILLGHLIGDGSYVVHQPLRYTTASEANSQAVAAAATALGGVVTRCAGRGNWHQLVIAGNGHRWQPAGVGAWLKRLRIFGQRSHEKRVPGDVFRLSDAQIALLLRHLWATDGCIHVARVGEAGRRGKSRVYFSTCSEGLAQDVAALLLRLGVVARIRASVSAGRRPVFSVDVQGVEAQTRFLQVVGAFGPREAPARALAQVLLSVKGNTNVDTLPRELFDHVRAEMAAQGISQRRMTALRGTAYGGTSHFRFAPSRSTLADYARLLGSGELTMWSESDLFWDRVVVVEPDGEEEVYDLTVPGPANWLADGVVTHNSGGIEQDADLVVFIYRDEVYNKDSPDAGTAEIIIAKQRNGPLGVVKTAFLGEFTRFDNLAQGYSEDGYA